MLALSRGCSAFFLVLLDILPFSLSSDSEYLACPESLGELDRASNGCPQVKLDGAKPLDMFAGSAAKKTARSERTRSVAH